MEILLCHPFNYIFVEEKKFRNIVGFVSLSCIRFFFSILVVFIFTYFCYLKDLNHELKCIQLYFDLFYFINLLVD